MEKDFLEFFQQTVTVEPCTGKNGAAEPTFGDPVTYPARVQQKNKMVRIAKQQDAISTAQIYLNGTAVVGTKDRITLPDGSQPLILSIDAVPDETGQIHHKVIYT